VDTQELRCVLPGCNEPIESSGDQRMQRKYCCAAHRIAARRLRQEVRADLAVAEPEEQPPAPSVKQPRPEPESCAKLPERESYVKLPSPESFVKVPLIWRSGSTGGMTMLHLERPEAVPMARRLSAHPLTLRPSSHSHAASFTGNLTAAAGRTMTAASLCTKRAAGRVRAAYLALESRSQWTIAVVAAAALISGAGFLASALDGGPVVTEQNTALRAAPVGMTQWSDRAQVALSAVRTQLGEINPAKTAWNSVPADKRTGELATKYSALQQQEGQLTKQEQQLEDALAKVDQLNGAVTDLSGTETQSVSLAKASNVYTASNVTLVGSQYNSAETRKALDARCADLERQIANLQPAVLSAMAAPLPGQTDSTIVLVNAVIQLAQQAMTPPPPPVVAPAPVVVTAQAAAPVRVRASVHRPAARSQSSGGSGGSGNGGGFPMNFVSQVLTGIGFGG
jgi:hypothetical protein